VRYQSVYPGRLRTSFRAHAEWYDATPDPAPADGNDPATVSGSIMRILDGERGAHVVGLRENAIDLADRLSPRLYDALVLRRRVRKRLEKTDKPK
jgi:hypothetical protein